MANEQSTPSTPAQRMARGLEVIRFLSQIAEACSLFVLEQGHDRDLVQLSVHCADRAEHVAQYFLEAPDEHWPLASALDDLRWLLEVDRHIQHVRAKVMRDIPSLGDIEELIDCINETLDKSA